MSKHVLRTGVTAVAIVAGMLQLGACSTMPPSTVEPATSINPPSGTRAMTLYASGVQIYACEYDAQHRLQWVFKSPQATLFDASGQPIVRHGAGPSWEAEDGSRIVGRVIAQRPSATTASIAQLLLESHSTGTAGILSDVHYVQRLDTVRGVAPSAPCTTERQSGSTPYLATYVFYR